MRATKTFPLNARDFAILCVALAVGVLFTAIAGAQAGTADISGTVRDSTGAVLPGVTVEISNAASGQSRQIITDGDGAYVAPLLPLGEYTIRAELPGFNTFVRQGVVLQVGQK